MSTTCSPGGRPAATSADFVALSVTIAAHELGYLWACSTGDSFGPMARASTSASTRAVQASVSARSCRRDGQAHHGVRGLGKRGAGKRSTTRSSGSRGDCTGDGEDGSPINEQTTPHYAMADAQPLALAPLVVPDTDLEGVNADKVFNVTAADFVGDLGLDSTGNSLTDCYSFTARPER